MTEATATRLRALPTIQKCDNPRLPLDPHMDAERINLIGTTLEGLQARTADLRRYL